MRRGHRRLPPPTCRADYRATSTAARHSRRETDKRPQHSFRNQIVSIVDVVGNCMRYASVSSS